MGESGPYTEEALVEKYVHFRPGYSDEVYQRIVHFCRQTSDGDQLAVDIACGPGQSTLPLAKYFKQVIGVDISKQQLANAPSHIPGVTFFASKAEHIPDVISGSVDLVTVATAFHWLAIDEIYREVDRILKPGGSLAVYAYNLNTIFFDDPDVERYFRHIYSHVLREYFDIEPAKHYLNSSTSLPQPYAGWERLDDVVEEKRWTVRQLVGFIESWSPLHEYNKAHPDAKLIQEIHTEFNRMLSSKLDEVKNRSESALLKVSFTIHIKMVHKPMN